MRLGSRLPALGVDAATQTFAVTELLIVFLIGFSLGQLYLGDHIGREAFINAYVWPSILTVIVFAYLNLRSSLYGPDKLSRFTTYAGATIANLMLAFAVIALVAVVAGAADDFSRTWFGLWMLGSSVAVLTTRALAARIFSSPSVRGAISRRVAIFGDGRPLQDAIDALGADDSGASIVGVFRADAHRDGLADGTLDAVVELARREHLDTVVIALPLSQHRRLARTVGALSEIPAEIKLMPDIGGQAIPLHGVSSLAQVQFIDLQQMPLSGWDRFVKAVVDYTIATAAIVLLLPLFAVVAVAIKLDSRGPVIFRQVRHGLNNREIEVFKFRTMHVQPQGEAFRQATRDDMRVTRVGRLLRRTSIDELPQLFNVLRGEMSIVGPRPHAVEMNDAYAQVLPLYNTRHRVKPGITGWAQINDLRGPTRNVDDMRKRLDHDLHYIQNWSPMFDLSIIATTPFVGLTHKNAV